jgi:hypothetical protein
MIVYAITKDGDFIGEHQCQPDPLARGWLYPSYYTDIEPPELPAYKKLFFNQNTKSWELKNNFLNIPIWNQQTKEQQWCNFYELPAGFTAIEPILFGKWDNKFQDWIFDIDQLKDYKKNQIRQSFENQLSTGKIQSSILKIEIDARRNNTKNDLQNCHTLLSYMQRNNIENIIYVGVSNNSSCTQKQLENLIIELEDYALSLYQKKWKLLEQINLATDEKEVNSINW